MRGLRLTIEVNGNESVGEQQNDELVDSYLMRFEWFIYMSGVSRRFLISSIM
jgi:hypothetical protein